MTHPSSCVRGTHMGTQAAVGANATPASSVINFHRSGNGACPCPARIACNADCIY